MEQTPYDPPNSEILKKEPQKIPKHIKRNIRAGVIGALISGCITLGMTVYSIVNTSEQSLFNVWNIMDVALIFLLAIGIYKKSRIAAISMLVYFIASKILIIVETGKFTGALFMIIFILLFIQSVLGTIQYHNYINKKKLSEK